MFSLSVRFRPSRTPSGEGRVWYVIRQGEKTRTIASEIRSADPRIIHIAKDRLVFDLKSISRTIEDMCYVSKDVSLDDVIDKCSATLRGENPYTELIERLGSHFPVRNDITRISKEYADCFEIVRPAPVTDSSVMLLEYIDRLAFDYRKDGKSSSGSYRSTRHSLSRFLDGKDIAIDSVNTTLINDYRQYLSTIVSPETASFYIRVLRSTLNHARREGFFNKQINWPSTINSHSKIQKATPPLRTLDRDTMRRIADLDLTGFPDAMLVRDIFMFSFYAQGIELVDLANLRITSLTDNHLSYRRRIKGRLVSVHLGENALAIIKRHHEPQSQFLFPLLHQGSKDYSFSWVKTRIRTALQTISKLIDADITLSFGMSRNTWLQLSNTINQSESMI